MRQITAAVGFALCAICMVNAQNLLSEPGNWQIMSSGVDTTIGDDRITVITDQTSSGVIINNDTSVTDYTVSTSFSTTLSTHQGIGICFSYTLSGGYFFYVNSKQQFVLTEYNGSNQTSTLRRYLPRSWIQPGENTLSVSRFGSTIKLFCNGLLLDSLTDDTYTDNGRVGLFLSSNTEATYSSFTLSADDRSASPRTCYTLNPSSSSPLSAWYTSYPFIESTYIQENALRFSTKDTTFASYAYVNGAFSSHSARAVIKKVDGNDETIYGVALYDVAGSTNYQYKSLALVRKAGFKQYAILTPGTNSYTISTLSNINASGRDDTLAIILTDAGYRFRINDTILDTTVSPADFTPEAAGLYIGSDLTISCNAFACAPDTSYSCPVFAHKFSKPSPYALSADQQQQRAHFSIMGRRIIRRQRSIAAGVYIRQHPEAQKSHTKMLIRRR